MDVRLLRINIFLLLKVWLSASHLVSLGGFPLRRADRKTSIIIEPDCFRSAAYDGEQFIGVCEYDNTWTIFHTEVNPYYGGQGIAERLVLAVDKHAKALGQEVRSTCSYAFKVLGR